MRKLRWMAVAVAVVLAGAPGCNTVVGVGRDIKAVGRTVGKVFGGGTKDKDKKKKEKKREQQQG